MRAGDLEKIETIRRAAHGPDFYISDVIYSRMTGDLEASDSKARECVRQAELQDGPSTAFICKALMAGNNLMHGNIAEWATKLAQLKSFSGEFIEGTRLPVRSVLDDVDDFSRWTHIPVASILNSPKRPYRLPFKHVFSPGGMDDISGVFLDIQMNGHPVTLSFDTGSFSTIISTADARAAKIPLQQGWVVVQGTTGANTSSSLGIAKQVHIGDIALSQWPVVSLPDARLGAIGLDVMSHLGPMLITYDGVQLLSRDEMEAISCQKPIALSSLLTGWVGGLRFPVTIDGAPHMALLDTGSSSYLTKMGGQTDEMSPARQKDIQTANGRFTTNYSEKKVSLIAGPIRTSVTAEILPVPKLDYEYSLGSGFLKDANVFIDFSSRRACILPKDITKSDVSVIRPDAPQG